jgi:methionyl-tRNA synthetase
MYVWVDALTNYLTGTGYPDASAERARFWPAQAHVIGKDITRFHAVFWPAFLMSADLPVPRQIVVHGFLFNRGEKMSKSIGNVIDPVSLIETYGVDQIRYFFLREVPFGQDGNYSHEAIVNRINADLANDLGNLAQRSLSMIAKNCNGVVPRRAVPTPADAALLDSAYGLPAVVRESLRDFALHQMLADIWQMVADANRYFATEEPWKKRETDPLRMEAVLYVTAEVLRVIGLLVQPFMPASMEKLLDLLGVAPTARDFAQADAEHRLQSGAPLPQPVAIFPRYVEPEATAP